VCSIIDQLNRKLPGNLGRSKGEESDNLSKLSGDIGPPALEFTKAICKVLELDKTVTIEVSQFKTHINKKY
jgi:hypothetical protein